MLDIIILISGALSGWFAKALIDWGRYYGIFGNLKYWFVKKFMNDQEIELSIDIITDAELSATEAEERLDNDVYWFVAKKSKLVYLSMCPYCLGFWIFQFIVFFHTWPTEFGGSQIILSWIFGVSLLYFFLNFAKK